MATPPSLYLAMPSPVKGYGAIPAHRAIPGANVAGQLHMLPAGIMVDR